MPAKAPIDENVKFLFACLIRSDYKTVYLPLPFLLPLLLLLLENFKGGGRRVTNIE